LESGGATAKNINHSQRQVSEKISEKDSPRGNPPVKSDNRNK